MHNIIQVNNDEGSVYAIGGYIEEVINFYTKVSTVSHFYCYIVYSRIQYVASEILKYYQMKNTLRN